MIRPRPLTRTLLAFVGVGLILPLAACTATPAPQTSSPVTTAPATTTTTTDTPTPTQPELNTYTPGVLTVATGDPAYSPWVEDNDPTTGQGFESAVIYAVAQQLGYTNDQVVWVRTTFDAAIAPGPKAWDMNIQQFTITDERKQAVDFSTPYYTTNQAIVTYSGSPADGVTTLAGLAKIKFGAQVGTTSLTALTDIVKPTSQPKIFNSSDDVVHALVNKQVEAIVVDLPTALYLTSAELDNGVIVGQLSSSSGGDDFGILLPKGSSLTAPVSAAIDALRANGTLDQIQQKWLSDSISVPVLQ